MKYSLTLRNTELVCGNFNPAPLSMSLSINIFIIMVFIKKNVLMADYKGLLKQNIKIWIEGEEICKVSSVFFKGIDNEKCIIYYK